MEKIRRMAEQNWAGSWEAPGSQDERTDENKGRDSEFEEELRERVKEAQASAKQEVREREASERRDRGRLGRNGASTTSTRPYGSDTREGGRGSQTS